MKCEQNSKGNVRYIISKDNRLISILEVSEEEHVLKKMPRRRENQLDENRVMEDQLRGQMAKSESTHCTRRQTIRATPSYRTCSPQPVSCSHPRTALKSDEQQAGNYMKTTREDKEHSRPFTSSAPAPSRSLSPGR